MKTTMFITLLIFALSTCVLAYAEDAWLEVAESSAYDYETPASKEIPASDDVQLSMDDITDMSIEEPSIEESSANNDALPGAGGK